MTIHDKTVLVGCKICHVYVFTKARHLSPMYDVYVPIYNEDAIQLNNEIPYIYIITI